MRLEHVFLALAAFLVLVVSAQDECKDPCVKCGFCCVCKNCGPTCPQKCIATGDDCKLGDKCCDADSRCRLSKCKKLLPSGSKCKLDQDCLSERCVSGACAKPCVNVGVSCVTADVCCGNDTSCRSNKCRLPPQTEGSKCVDNEDCQSLLCDNGLCKNPCIKTGLACSGKDTCCDKGTECRVGLCKPLPVPEGSPCVSNDDCTTQFCDQGTCKKPCVKTGLSCKATDTCCDEGNECRLGQCKLPPQPEGSPCKGNDDCVTNFCDQNVCKVPCVKTGLACKDTDTCCEEGNECRLGRCKLPPQPEGSKCKGNDDCVTNFCDQNVCKVPCVKTGLACKAADTCCEEGTECRLGLCKKLPQPEGAPCQGNDDCVTKYCDNNVCKVPCVKTGLTCKASDTCCEEGTECRLGLCKLLPQPEGSSCKGNDDCVTNYCDENICKVPCVKTGITCKVGDTCCEEGSECRLGLCKKLPQPKGSPCEGNDDCVSQLCEDNVCATPKPPCVKTGLTCKEGADTCCDDGTECRLGLCKKLPQPEGSPCEGNDDCVSKLCEDNVCATPKQPCVQTGLTCKSTDTCCDEGTECRSGLCKKVPQPPGSSCKTNDDCISQNCIESICQPVCLKSGAKCGEDDCCEKGTECRDGQCKTELQPIGGKCKVGADCKSGNCEKGVCKEAQCIKAGKPCNEGDCCEEGTECRDGACKTQLQPIGGKCKVGEDCQSGYCDKGVCKERKECAKAGKACDAQACCEKGYECRGGVCKKTLQPIGGKCKHGEDCKSGFCKEGKCQEKECAEIKEPCEKHKDCCTGGCYFGYCFKCQPYRFCFTKADCCTDDAHCWLGLCFY